MPKLPKEVQDLFKARDSLRHSLSTINQGRLPFAFDGNLVGDLGEWIAIEEFGMELSPAGRAGVDGTIDGETVQVKATITGKQAAFRYLPEEILAQRLLVFKICEQGHDYEVIYDGPQKPVVEQIYARWNNKSETRGRQRSISANQLRKFQEQHLKVAP
ncbi:DUF6998 domain-containing protein [Tsuneonella suprasediminis]|uniref:DUF6998 domain-containing protein n=1 Tax=Tsuneonella suprasediminis TaxID=2306996 RepID=UPI002F9420F8